MSKQSYSEDSFWDKVETCAKDAGRKGLEPYTMHKHKKRHPNQLKPLSIQPLPISSGQPISSLIPSM